LHKELQKDEEVFYPYSTFHVDFGVWTDQMEPDVPAIFQPIQGRGHRADAAV
jgi:hypothetical protein